MILIIIKDIQENKQYSKLSKVVQNVKFDVFVTNDIQILCM